MTGDKRPERDPIDGDSEELRSAWADLPPAEPPKLIDRAVLNAARRAVERPARPRWWLGAFATASAMILALAVVLQQDWESTTLPMEELELQSRPERGLPGEATEPAREREAKAPPPERWIELLRQLRAAGDDTAFSRQLAEFRATYPDYPLPADLTE